ncbi:MAG: hypothetical protein ACOC1O_02960 [bacterium]
MKRKRRNNYKYHEIFIVVFINNEKALINKWVKYTDRTRTPKPTPEELRINLETAKNFHLLIPVIKELFGK